MIEYKIQDSDGDTSTAKLKIDINTRPEVDLNGAGQGADGTASFVEEFGTATGSQVRSRSRRTAPSPRMVR